MMMINEQNSYNVLLGGVDELTKTSWTIMKRLGIYKDVSEKGPDIFTDRTEGSIAGEGAVFFTASGIPKDAYASVDAIKTLYKPASTDQTKEFIKNFLEVHGLIPQDIDAVIMGYSADKESDGIYDLISDQLFADNNILNYKPLCGEYFTSVSFAVWAAANILKLNVCPDAMKIRYNGNNALRRILIYNHFKNSEHSLILLSAC